MAISRHHNYMRSPIADGCQHIWLVTSDSQSASVPDYFKDLDIDKTLANSGAILFRGFQVRSDNDFASIVNAVSLQNLNYVERSTQRREIARHVYTSTEYPSHKTIAIHSENSFQLVVPSKILFFAKTACDIGGETPIADNTRVLDELTPEIREEFKSKGILYSRNYDGGFDLSWQEAFQTDNPQEVEVYCDQNKIEYTWLSDTHLRTQQFRPATRLHPYTEKEVWFNQVHLFHSSNLDNSIRKALISSLGVENLPRHARFGDGTEIPDDVIHQIRSAFERSQHIFPWKTGDVLIADNIRVSHGRKPFEGSREIRVALVDPISN